MLASPDHPIWALTRGRSNPLSSSLRRFEEAILFSNDADIVQRLVSTVAGAFVTPSRSRQGGYRLGNLEPLNGPGGGLSLRDAPFNTTSLVGQRTLVDCTNHRDSRAGSHDPQLSRWLSASTTHGHGGRVFNDGVTAA